MVEDFKNITLAAFNHFEMSAFYRNGIIFAMFLHLVLSLALGTPWPGTDDLCYLNQAEKVVNGTYHFDESPKNQRIAIILPTYVAIGLFGKTPLTIALYPLLCSMISILMVMWFLKSNATTAILSGLLLACNITQITFARVLFPDVILALFIFASIYLVWNRKSGHWFRPTAAALLLVSGFFVKQLIVLVVPYLGFIVIKDLIKGEHVRFARIFILTLTISTASVVILVYNLTGDWFFLLNTIEANHNEVFASLDGLALWNRLTYEPLLFLSGLTGFWPLLILAAAGMMSKKESVQEGKLRELFLYLLLVFWLASTSIKSYSPVLLLDRMWMPLLIPLCGLAAIGFGKTLEFDVKKQIIVYVVFLLTAIRCMSEGSEGEAVFYMMIPLAILTSKRMLKKQFPAIDERFKLGLALPFFLLAIWFVWSNSLHLN